MTSGDALAALLGEGDRRKRQAATRMNDRSSRAHTLLLFRLRQQRPHMAEAKESVMILADLGGSEKLTKSGANEGVKGPGAINAGGDANGDCEEARVTWDEYYKSRQRMTETTNINKGLLVLKRCVYALRDSSNANNAAHPKRRPKNPIRVPFYDSMLTQLLEPALGGPSRTVILVCASQEPEHAEETVGSLRFGEDCRLVERSGAKAHISDAVRSAVAAIDSEVKEIEGIIKEKEHWATRTTTKAVVVSAMDTGGAVLAAEEEMDLGGKGAVVFGEDTGDATALAAEAQVTGAYLTGAETERARMEALLDKRRRLLGRNVLV